jgi:hypothetical protein
MHDVRSLDRAEGAAMHHGTEWEESIDWFEPTGLTLLVRGPNRMVLLT